MVGTNFSSFPNSFFFFLLSFFLRIPLNHVFLILIYTFFLHIHPDAQQLLMLLIDRRIATDLPTPRPTHWYLFYTRSIQQWAKSEPRILNLTPTVRYPPRLGFHHAPGPSTLFDGDFGFGFDDDDDDDDESWDDDDYDDGFDWADEHNYIDGDEWFAEAEKKFFGTGDIIHHPVPFTTLEKISASAAAGKKKMSSAKSTTTAKSAKATPKTAPAPVPASSMSQKLKMAKFIQDVDQEATDVDKWTMGEEVGDFMPGDIHHPKQPATLGQILTRSATAKMKAAKTPAKPTKAVPKTTPAPATSSSTPQKLKMSKLLEELNNGMTNGGDWIPEDEVEYFIPGDFVHPAPSSKLKEIVASAAAKKKAAMTPTQPVKAVPAPAQAAPAAGSSAPHNQKPINLLEEFDKGMAIVGQWNVGDSTAEAEDEAEDED